MLLQTTTYWYTKINNNKYERAYAYWYFMKKKQNDKNKYSNIIGKISKFGPVL